VVVVCQRIPAAWTPTAAESLAALGASAQLRAVFRMGTLVQGFVHATRRSVQVGDLPLPSTGPIVHDTNRSGG
jgi:hypothetical protein